MQDRETTRSKVRISDEVVAICTANVLYRTKGIYRLQGGIIENFINSQNQGIRITRNDDAVNVDLNIVADYDVQIPQVAWDTQVNVKKEIEHITGLSVNAVNIHVQGVRLPDEEENDDKKLSKR